MFYSCYVSLVYCVYNGYRSPILQAFGRSASDCLGASQPDNCYCYQALGNSGWPVAAQITAGKLNYLVYNT